MTKVEYRAQLEKSLYNITDLRMILAKSLLTMGGLPIYTDCC